MKTFQEDYLYILNTPAFEIDGQYSFQVYNGVIESCNDGRFRKFIGKTTKELEAWINKQECKTALDFTQEQKDDMQYEEETRKRKEWERDNWVCMEGGDGYFN